MWLVTFKTIPNQNKNAKAAEEFGGAYVNCWIDFALEDGAVELAKFYIKQNDWIPLRLEGDNVWYNEEDCETTEDRQYFAEAKDYGATLVWYTYPLEATEDDEDFELENSTTTNPKIKTTEH
ncbi:MAG: hypothetical protein M3405_15700 [Acidobacteriota bacterium]|jgi:hypothetical protein|nr:hypothetical protein [Acidobacteriota bacterium]